MRHLGWRHLGVGVLNENSIQQMTEPRFRNIHLFLGFSVSNVYDEEDNKEAVEGKEGIQ